MSLFKAREWWRVNCGHDEEFDKACLCAANVDNDPSEDVKIVVGSFQGYLRIYHPKSPEFKVEDLMLEQNLESPILQVAAGTFTTNGGISLAVLHPRKLSVYTLVPVGTNQQQASYFQLQKNYEHKLERTAANFVTGPFGGAANDYMCVQSMDGQLTVFEHETIAFSRFLHNFLLPGALCFNKKTDSFITANASFEVECYKYQVLASSSGEKSDGSDESGLTQKKKVQVDWSFVVGELVVDILVAKFSRSLTAGQADCLVLGEHTLFAISEIGEPRLQIRFDFTPTAMFPFSHTEEDPSGGAHQSLVISTTTGALMVYRDTQLIWAAKNDIEPVALYVGQFGGLKGLVTVLDETGCLLITYMGTDPPLNVVGGFEGKELNYEEMDEEHRRLLGIIRAATSETKAEPTEKVQMRAQVPNRLDSAPGANDDDGGQSGMKSITIRIFASYQGHDTLENVQVTVKAPSPLTVNQDLFTLPTLQGNQHTPVILSLTVYAGAECLPSSNVVTVIAAYTTHMGEPRTAHCEVKLPMCLFCQVVAPLKNAGFKITLDTNRMPPLLTNLFDDLVQQSHFFQQQSDTRSASNNVLSFQYWSGQDVTILVSKSAGRYRLQSGCFEAMWLVASELCDRLTTYFQSAQGASMGGGDDGPFAVTFTEALPLQDFFNLVDAHFAARQTFAKTGEKLGERAHQFRSIQKRLLVRFKDRNPASLTHLDTLLEGTFQQLNELGQGMSAIQEDLYTHANRLSCGCEVILLLIKCRFGLDAENFELLRGYLSPVVEDSIDQGWEEVTEAAMTHLLRTALAKSSKESAGANMPLTMASLTDTSKLKKHIGVVCERLARGARLNGSTVAPSKG
ncbi:hypothetical protein CYMTET_39543 [Cymbomonas tetramitiformis]|uniref:Uncharacterized protein n=1 Tax=Cymbomonas tetramitiformis TaxID=36881 RepID=A0AAE0F446_9CHLO|nr:hypothetical protein CYMTET_39543 [Cymbomonas tetramitiformis]|eukprot:gene2752-3533_t